MGQVKESVLSELEPSKAIVKLAVPATLALLAKAVYNIVDTAYIGMLHSDIALAAVGVTLPLLLIMVSVENIFAAGAAVLAGRQLGANDKERANVTVTTIVGLSIVIGLFLCVAGIIFMGPLLRSFGASEAVLPQAKEYALWMFIAALANHLGIPLYDKQLFTESSRRSNIHESFLSTRRRMGAVILPMHSILPLGEGICP